MTQDQATELIAAIHDLQQIGMGIGSLLAVCSVWLAVLALQNLFVIFLSAIKR